MPQGLNTYSLAERAEMTADFTKAAFRLRQGLKFHDGYPLTTKDVKWTYENYKGVNFKIFQDKLDHIELVDDRTIIVHFKQPFVEFIDLYNGGSTGIVWILPQHYYQRVGREGFIGCPLGAGPFRFVSQEAGVQMVFEAWEEYWRRTPAAKMIIVKSVRDPASRLAGLQTGELDLAFGMTGKPLTTAMADRNLRWDPNLTAPWWLAFPGYAGPIAPSTTSGCDRLSAWPSTASSSRSRRPRASASRGATGSVPNTVVPCAGTAPTCQCRSMILPRPSSCWSQRGIRMARTSSSWCLSHHTTTMASGFSPICTLSASGPSCRHWRGQCFALRPARVAKAMRAIAPSC
jgi:hypothetical protein